MSTTRLISLIPVTCATLCGQTDWTQLAPASSPLALTAHTMTYHLPTDRTVLFGGVAGGIRRNDTWLFDGSNWTQANPATVPPARVAHAMALDFVRGRLVMFGGIPAGGGLLGDTWEWDGVDWHLMAPVNSPPPRRSFPLVYHPDRGTTVLWGGYDVADRNDMWEWDGTDWAPIVTVTSPSPRRASDMAYDPVTQSLVLFSGYLQTNDTWRFDGVDWLQVFPATSPTPRYDHSMVTDLARGRIVSFGGPGPADTWEWDGVTWLNRTTTTLPAARSDTYLAYDWLREEVLMFGSSLLPETWRYAPTVPATYATSGSGCLGSHGLSPALQAQNRPWLGDTFSVRILQVPPNSIAFMISGLSDTTWSLGALPASLAAIGMPSCSLQVDPVIFDPMLATGTFATWSLFLPIDPALLGVTFFNQGGALDPGANPAGLIVGNHGAAVIGGK